MKGASRPVLIVDAYMDAVGAVYYTPWLDGPWEAVHAPVAPLPAFDPDRWSGVVVTGSRASVCEQAPWMGATIDLLRAAMDADVPVLGCCFGHQLLAVAQAGPDAVAPRTPPEVGYPDIELERGDPLFDALPATLRTFVSHEDFVAPVAGLDVLGRSDDCAVHALRIPGRRAWGVQFHVEYSLEEEERILRYRAQRHPELGLDVDGLLAQRPDVDSIARALFGGFQAICATRSTG